MKILHLTGDREDMGGILSVIRNLQAVTADTGWEHAVWVNREYRETRRPPLDYRVSRHITVDSLPPPTLLLRSARAFFELRRLLRSEHFDVVHAHARGGFLVGLAAARWLGRRILFTNHMYARRVRMYRQAAGTPGFCTVVLTPNMARHYGLEPDPPRVSIISACCADEYFERPLRSDRASNTRIRLVGVGNVMRWKNWHLVLEALARLPEATRPRFEFSIWGPTYTDADSIAYERELRDGIGRHGLETVVKLRGNTHDVQGVLAGADWFVLPSTNEPCSVALTEALASGLPAIASASGGNIDIIEPDRTGLLFRPDDSVDLADRLASIADGRLSLKNAAEIRRSVEYRCASRVAAAYEPLYRHVAHPAQPSPVHSSAAPAADRDDRSRAAEVSGS